MFRSSNGVEARIGCRSSVVEARKFSVRHGRLVRDPNDNGIGRGRPIPTGGVWTEALTQHKKGISPFEKGGVRGILNLIARCSDM
jgi:hypothetical protein